MAEVLMMDPTPKVTIHNYPAEHRYVRWGTFASIGMHLTVALIVFIIAYLNHIKSLAEFMRGSIAQPPPPANQIEIILPPDDTPPPPTDNPLFIKQILQVPKPPPPIIPPKPKPKPVPHPIAEHHVESHSTQAAEMVIGSADLPHPGYPPQALQRHITGTVTVRVSFDGSGGVSSVDVVNSSGSSILDNGTLHFILENWHEAALAGQTQTGNVVYNLQ